MTLANNKTQICIDFKIEKWHFKIDFKVELVENRETLSVLKSSCLRSGKPIDFKIDVDFDIKINPFDSDLNPEDNVFLNYIFHEVFRIHL